jgi:hypothetical protein
MTHLHARQQSIRVLSSPVWMEVQDQLRSHRWVVVAAPMRSQLRLDQIASLMHIPRLMQDEPRMFLPQGWSDVCLPRKSHARAFTMFFGYVGSKQTARSPTRIVHASSLESIHIRISLGWVTEAYRAVLA